MAPAERRPSSRKTPWASRPWRFLLGLALVASSLGAPLNGLAASGTTAVPDPEKRTPVTVRGEVIETGCYVIGGRHGPRHRQCAIACARAGQDLGILDEETGLLLVEIRDQRESSIASALLPHVAERVEVRGEQLERGGLLGIEINRVRALDPPPS